MILNKANMRTEQDRERCYQIAKTINEQLFWSIDLPTFWSWGVSKKVFTFYNDMPSLKLRVSGLVHKGWVVVSLNEGRDTYDVRLLNVKEEEKAVYEDVYADVLGSFIDDKIERPVSMTTDEYGRLAERDSKMKMAF